MGFKCSTKLKTGRKNLMKNVAIVLAAGQGKRMKSKVQKQFLLIKEKPVLYYTLNAFESNPLISEIILVTGKDEIEYCQQEIVDKYGFKKVCKIVAGGKERYHSVHNGIQAIEDAEYVFIHDGARPFVDAATIERVYEAVKAHKACVVGMPVKDTIKIADEDGFAAQTPDRRKVWQVQTPQTFEYHLIKEAYEKLMIEEPEGITDDAMVVETMTKHSVKLVEGSYQNIKITTPEDLQIATIFCES